MTALIMIGAAVLPSLILLVYFIFGDRFPEPLGGILGTFFFGVLTVIPVLVFAAPLTEVLQPDLLAPIARAATEGFILAAIPEEAFKLAVLVAFARNLKAFDEPMDGLVYGVVASLGFATLENIAYVIGSGDGWLSIAILRALTAVPAHATFGAIMGFYIARAHFEPARRRSMLFAAYLVPMVLHGLYDLGLLATSYSGDIAWIVLGLGTLIIAVVWALRLQRRLRREQQAMLAGTAAASLAAGPHELRG
ncbi:PrsW family intramembrane metalloprotease [Zavarzinia compransoris]|uniref:Protease PrsW n=1 Tax=Zavarzinia compransoris TaxID=1264899 RepID=A0A317EEC2_9PROT|nr:PrsW family intramembrane metalloprotease [Zavarzinia compransoris]PWR23703.1 PrsW family intramembrane metalloprotease [Zavarzinia compransoris]TDP47925.1 RsiW-degrading membrane proteinase PrsW (M82 family) [Zavarzinia compransoris]